MKQPVHLLSVSAPGKLLLCGEYAVLRGAHALVTAVNARAYVTQLAPGQHDSTTRDDDSPAWSHLPPEVVLTRDIVQQACNIELGALGLDVRELRTEGLKLGLGSSAAAAAATAGLGVAMTGATLQDAATKQSMFSLAMKGHHSVAPQGSGADVAASAWGGTLRFVPAKHFGPAKHAVPAKHAGAPSPTGSLPTVTSVDWPEGLFMRVVWTGKEVRTSTFVAKMEALGQRNSQTLDSIITDLADVSKACCDAFEQGNKKGTLEAVQAYHHGMRALGDAMDAPVVEACLERVAQLAGAHGGAAKPSGAGGGDVAVAFFDDAENLNAFDNACEAEGIRGLSLAYHADGPRAEHLAQNAG